MLHHGLNTRTVLLKHIRDAPTKPNLLRAESTYSAIHRGLRRSEGSDRPSRGRDYGAYEQGRDARSRYEKDNLDYTRNEERGRSAPQRPRASQRRSMGRPEDGFAGRDMGSKPVERSRKSERRPWDSRGPEKSFGQERYSRGDVKGQRSKDDDYQERPPRSRIPVMREYASEMRNAYEKSSFRSDRTHGSVEKGSDRSGSTAFGSRRSTDERSDGMRERRSPYDHRRDKRSSMPFDEFRSASNNHREADAAEPLQTAGNSSKLVTHYTENHDRALPAWIRIPYTTAASQFIYGHSAVLAAVKARRRKMYKLYIHNRGAGEQSETRNGSNRLDTLKKKALTCGINVKEVDDRFVPMMDRLSGGRPHNGCLLEASPLPNPSIEGLQEVTLQDETFTVIPSANQSAEDLAVNGTTNEFSYNSGGWRYPLLLYLDGITDEGNMGAIFRSAYILGVDGIVMESRNNATLSAVTLKASSGAAEALQIFKLPGGPSRMQFFKTSRDNGWRVYAANMPSGSGTPGSPSIIYNRSKGAPRHGSVSQSKMQNHSPLSEAPSILVLGNEETGVTKELLRLADYHVGIGLGRTGSSIGLDSFNVSVAASLISLNFLQKPQDLQRRKLKDAETNADSDQEDEDRLF